MSDISYIVYDKGKILNYRNLEKNWDKSDLFQMALFIIVALFITHWFIK